MNDEQDQLERRLRRQPLRQVPPEWRAEILAAAREAQPSHHEPRITHHSWLSTLNAQLTAFFWPNPKAWAGLAALWVAIIAFNLATHEEPSVAGKKTRVSSQVLAEVREQKIFFAELVGGNEARDAEPPKLHLPRPRSGREQMVAV